MRKYAVLLLLTAFSFIFTSIFLVNNVSSQEEREFDARFREYNLQLEEYNKARDEYILKRAQYLRFQTLRAQEEAYDVTLALLKERDEVVILYLHALKARLGEALGVRSEVRDVLNLKIDEEINWFINHKETIPTAGTLEDLVDDSNQARARYPRVESLAYEAFANISNGRINDYQSRTNEIFANLREKIGEIRNEERQEYKLESRKMQIIDRWLFDAENKIIRSQEKHIQAQDSILNLPKFTGGRGQILGEYNRSLERLIESQLFLKEASLFMKEIVREIKILD